MREINEIIIHCSASEWGDARVITDWHVNGNGWDDIGYHFVILNGKTNSSGPRLRSLDGMVEVGRSLDVPGAHCYGHNKNSIGICLIGTEKFSLKQFNACIILCKNLIEVYGPMEISGHYNYSYKTCPNFSVKSLAYLVNHA
jgi:N-acetylmuramoyl-L-alanine amidase